MSENRKLPAFRTLMDILDNNYKNGHPTGNLPNNVQHLEHLAKQYFLIFSFLLFVFLHRFMFKYFI
jgi:hypothetical protein